VNSPSSNLKPSFTTSAALRPLSPYLCNPAFWRRYVRLMLAAPEVAEPVWREGGWGPDEEQVPLFSRAVVLYESYHLLTNKQAFQVGMQCRICSGRRVCMPHLACTTAVAVYTCPQPQGPRTSSKGKGLAWCRGKGVHKASRSACIGVQHLLSAVPVQLLLQEFDAAGGCRLPDVFQAHPAANIAL